MYQKQPSNLSGSLFERLQADDEMVHVRYGNEIEKTVASIKRNLVVVLNARVGSSQSSPDFGLGDFNGLSVGSSDMLREISAEIQRCIIKYEPRVDHVKVQFDREQNFGLELHFLVSAKVRIEHSSEQITIDLVLTDRRKFKVY